jgi:hypothetical protein
LTWSSITSSCCQSSKLINSACCTTIGYPDGIYANAPVCCDSNTNQNGCCGLGYTWDPISSICCSASNIFNGACCEKIGYPDGLDTNPPVCCDTNTNQNGCCFTGLTWANGTCCGKLSVNGSLCCDGLSVFGNLCCLKVGVSKVGNLVCCDLNSDQDGCCSLSKTFVGGGCCAQSGITSAGDVVCCDGNPLQDGFCLAATPTWLFLNSSSVSGSAKSTGMCCPLGSRLIIKGSCCKTPSDSGVTCCDSNSNNDGCCTPGLY